MEDRLRSVSRNLYDVLDACTVYTIHDTYDCLGKPHNHSPDAADSNAAEAVHKVRQMESTSQIPNHRIYCAVTVPFPSATMSRLPGEDALKKKAQKTRRKMNPRSPLLPWSCMMSMPYPQRSRYAAV